jgi:tryptophanyl-tRNA synthetase
MIRPALRLAARTDRSFYFMADYHALNTVRDAVRLRDVTLDAAASLLALGLDPERTALYRQSDVPETFELATILSALAPKGAMNRAHAYKAAVAANEAAGRSADDGVNMGLYTYPILMAADILLVGGDLVPVGRDQVQHVEIARDLADVFNATFGTTLRPPNADVDPAVEVVLGLDGRKMSKSYGNTISLFLDPGSRRRLVARIRTDSRRPEEPKDPATCLVFGLYRQFASEDERESMSRRYREGGIGYAEAKDCLAAAIERELGAAGERFRELRADEASLRAALADGADRARRAARATIARAREAVGAGLRLTR